MGDFRESQLDASYDRALRSIEEARERDALYTVPFTEAELDWIKAAFLALPIPEGAMEAKMHIHNRLVNCVPGMREGKS